MQDHSAGHLLGQVGAVYKILFTASQIDTDRHLPTLLFARDESELDMAQLYD